MHEERDSPRTVFHCVSCVGWISSKIASCASKRTPAGEGSERKYLMKSDCWDHCTGRAGKTEPEGKPYFLGLYQTCQCQVSSKCRKGSTKCWWLPFDKNFCLLPTHYYSCSPPYSYILLFHETPRVGCNLRRCLYWNCPERGKRSGEDLSNNQQFSPENSPTNLLVKLTPG